MKNYLIIGPSWVGDMVMAQVLFKAIKHQYPDASIDVLAPNWTEPILNRMPEVNHALTSPFNHGELKLKQRYQLAKQLRTRQYTNAIVLPNSLKSALIPYWAKIPIRTGWRGEMRYFLLNDIRMLDKKKLPKMIQRFVALAYDFNATVPENTPYPKLIANKNNQIKLIEKFKITQPMLALCPGAEFGPAKQWPIDYYHKVAQHMISDGWQVTLLGSKNDTLFTDELYKNLTSQEQSQCINLAGQTSLGDAVDFLESADAVVTNDSGLMHIASALSKPTVVIYGSSSPEFTPPLNDNAIMLSLGLECSPCFKRECPLGHLNCLKQLDPEMVIHSLKQFKHATYHLNP